MARFPDNYPRQFPHAKFPAAQFPSGKYCAYNFSEEKFQLHWWRKGRRRGCLRGYWHGQVLSKRILPGSKWSRVELSKWTCPMELSGQGMTIIWFTVWKNICNTTFLINEAILSLQWFDPHRSSYFRVPNQNVMDIAWTQVNQAQGNAAMETYLHLISSASRSSFCPTYSKAWSSTTGESLSLASFILEIMISVGIWRKKQKCKLLTGTRSG